MSRSYSIEIWTDVPFNLKNLELILQEGANYGFVYYEYTYVPDTTTIISPEYAAFRFYSKTIEQANEEECYTHIKYQDTDLFLIFSNDNEKINIYVGAASYKWYKEFAYSTQHFFDFARYIRLLLNAYKSFPITNIQTTTDY